MRVRVVRHVDRFVVRPVHDLAVQRKGGQLELEADHVALADGFARWEEVLRAGAVDFLSCKVADAVAVGVEADGRFQGRFASGDTQAHVPARVTVHGRGVVGVFDAAYNAAFPVPAAFSYPYVGSSHAEALLCCHCAAGLVEADVRGGVFVVEARSEGGGLRLAVVLGEAELGVGNAVGVAEALAVVDVLLRFVELAPSSSHAGYQDRWARRIEVMPFGEGNSVSD